MLIEGFQKGNKIWVGRKHTFETKERMSKSKKGKKLSEEHKKNIGNAHRGTQHKKGAHWKLSEEDKKRRSEARKGKPNFSLRGAGNPRWKGGITSMNQVIRHSLEYKLWHKAVFERDNYTCRFCGKRGNGELNADHIKPFAYFPELRFAIDNGRTLCKDCHQKTDSYGRQKNSKYNS